MRGQPLYTPPPCFAVPFPDGLASSRPQRGDSGFSAPGGARRQVNEYAFASGSSEPVAGQGPKQKPLQAVPLEQWPPEASTPPKTTVLVRHVDRSLRLDDVLGQLPRNAFYNYDLLYLQFDLKRNIGAGRILLNFETPAGAAAFSALWNVRVHPVLSSSDDAGGRRPLEVENAHVQGFRENVAMYQSRLRRDVGAEFAPVIYDRGHKCDFWDYSLDIPADRSMIPLQAGETGNR